MQSSAVIALALLAFAAPSGAENPLSKTIELLSSLEAKIVQEGEAEAKAYAEYIEWCDDATKNLGFDIKTATSRIEKLKAAIGKANACIEGGKDSIEDLAAAIAEGEGQLTNATLIRDKEHGDFQKGEGELMEGIDVLERAISILEREMAKNPALMQVDTSSFAALVQSLSTVIDAAAFSHNDRQKLMALVQQKQTAETSEDAAEDAKENELNSGAPDPAAYKTHSTNIVEVLQDMLDKAKGELADLRKAESQTQHNYDLLKLALEDEAAYNKKNMAEDKDKVSGCEGDLAGATDDLAKTEQDLAEAQKGLATAQSSCMQVAADHQTTMTNRAEELKALAMAKKILQETTAGAEGHTYSFLQVSSGSGSKLRTRADLAGAEVVSLINRLAKEHHSAALAQLASKVSVVMRYGEAGGDDVFAKVKGLIRDLIDRLMSEAAAEATEKAYCDEQMAKTEAKKSDLEDNIAGLTAKIDKAAAASAGLKEDVKVLQGELAALAKLQAEMDSIRAAENAAYQQAKADLTQGLEGVRKALEVLRNYYGAAEEEALLQAQQPPKPELHEKAGGAGGGIINILEVVESDFAADLAAEETQEADAASEYAKISQENKITKATKEQDVKYKSQEFTALDKAIAEDSNERDTANTELSAVVEYYAKIKDRCIAKPETYEERKKRRTAEIAGLKEALKILEAEALLQRGSRRSVLRHIA